MNPINSEVLIALITGVIGIIVAIINSKTNINKKKIEKQNVITLKKGLINKRLEEIKEAKNKVIHEMVILTLETNLNILEHTMHLDEVVDSNIYKVSEDLKERWEKLNDETNDVHKEYELVLELIEEMEKENSK